MTPPAAPWEAPVAIGIITVLVLVGVWVLWQTRR